MPEEFPATWTGGHALIIEFGDEELYAHCQCGTLFGTGNPATPLDEFARPWERHVASRPPAGPVLDPPMDLTEAHRRINDLRSLESEYRSALTAHLESILARVKGTADGS